MIFTVMVQAKNVKSIQELRDLKTYKEKLSFDFEIEFEFVIKKKIKKIIVNFKDFKIAVVLGQVSQRI